MASFGPHQSAHDLVPAALEKPSSLTPLSLLKHSWFRWLWLCITAPILLYWQFQLALQPQQLDHTYSNRAGVGVHREEAFVYFLYHLNLYPLATTLQEPEDSATEARRLIEQEADTLRTEVNHTARYGEHLKSHLLLLDALQKQSTRHPSYTFANGWAFRIALLALLISFCWAGYPFLATVLVVVLGSNPFQLHEIYARENVHGWVITTAIVLLALMVPVLKANRGRIYPWFAALLSALWLGSVVHIRSEPVVMLLAVAAAFLLMEKVSILQRLALVVVLFLGYGTVSTAWHDYFTWKIEQSTQVVQKAGGVPYQGPREFTHQFWHPLHVGLADFDQKYGFKWDDRWAARKLFPRLREQGVEIPPWDGTTYRFMDAWHDDGKRYYKALLLIPGFYE
ncbi:MAG: hypothetical protein G8345_17160, partial [Magnetococcales bacterium]|nr:hypothetical protein [Magnetococcales bacterium]